MVPEPIIVRQEKHFDHLMQNIGDALREDVEIEFIEVVDPVTGMRVPLQHVLTHTNLGSGERGYEAGTFSPVPFIGNNIIIDPPLFGVEVEGEEYHATPGQQGFELACRFHQYANFVGGDEGIHLRRSFYAASQTVYLVASQGRLTENPSLTGLLDPLRRFEGWRDFPGHSEVMLEIATINALEGEWTDGTIDSVPWRKRGRARKDNLYALKETAGRLLDALDGPGHKYRSMNSLVAEGAGTGHP